MTLMIVLVTWACLVMIARKLTKKKGGKRRRKNK